MTEEKPEQNSHPEPTVLDYFLAKLRPWRGPAPEIPPLPDADAAPVVRPAYPAEQAASVNLEETILGRLPWRALAGLFFALVGQFLLMPPSRMGMAGSFFFALAVGMVIWGVFRQELSLAEPVEHEPHHDTFEVALTPLLVGIGVSLVAFLTFSKDKLTGEQLYTDLNVLLWLTGLGLILWAFWVPRPNFSQVWTQVTTFVRKQEWTPHITRHMVLVAIVFLIAVFFRVNRLGQVVPEMFSDHAEKLLDVVDVLEGKTRIFFPRNTGREGLQFYMIAWASKLFNTGVSFLSMKIGTVFMGLFMLPYMYLLGKELGNRNVGLLAMLFTGISYWPNILARVALRFILYPAFAAPALYYLVRGLRTGKRGYFVLSGIFLGIGLHSYTPFRAVPIMVVVTIFLFWLHNRSKENLSKATVWLGIITFVSLIIFLPLLRVWMQQPAIFNFRTMSRLTNLEVGDNMASGWSLLGVFWKNVWDGLLMFNWDSGNIWVNTLPHTPSLDLVGGAAFVLGVVLVLMRYLEKRRWEDGFLLFGLPVLMLPSTLVLAFPQENPAPNRAGGAAVVVFILVALALEAILRSIRQNVKRRAGQGLMAVAGVLLALIAIGHNYNLTFNQFPKQYTAGSWNTSELGAVIKQFTDTVGSPDQAWVVAYPHWVDTRLVGINAGFPTRDFAIWPEDFGLTQTITSPKLFLLKPEDEAGLAALEELYPDGQLSLYDAELLTKDFFIYFVP